MVEVSDSKGRVRREQKKLRNPKISIPQISRVANTIVEDLPIDTRFPISVEVCP